MDEFDAMEDPETNADLDQERSWASPGYSTWEEECLREAEEVGDIEGQMASEKDLTSRKLFVSFQTAACCIAQLYKDRQQGVSLWVPFQNAASSVTNLYKDCIESQKRIGELSHLSGSQRRNKEVISWLKKRKRNHIRRDELIAFLCGKNGNGTKSSSSLSHHSHHLVNRSNTSWSHSSPRQRLSMSPDVTAVAAGGLSSVATSSSSLGLHATIKSPHNNIALTCLSLSDPPTNVSSNDANNGDLQTFRDALALSAVAGIRNLPQSSPINAFSANSFNRRSNSGLVRSGPVSSGATAGLIGSSSLAELNAFITEEFTRHVDSKKRSATSTDVIMGSPTHKKPKFL